MPRPLSVSQTRRLQVQTRDAQAPNLNEVPMALTLLPMRLVSESNMREHWRARNLRRHKQRADTYYWLKHWFPVPPPLPLTISLIRVAPRLLDWDNCVSSFKAVQDGCADWLDNAPGKGQDRQPGLMFQYGQRRGKAREYAVQIRIEPGEETP